MKVARVLIYDMDERAMADALSRALPDGTRTWFRGQSIRVVTLPSRWGLRQVWRALRGK